MTMIARTAPRRLYSTRGTLAVCFNGVLYAPAAGTETEFLKDIPVTIAETLENGSVTVKQRKAHAKGRTEVWVPLA